MRAASPNREGWCRSRHPFRLNFRIIFGYPVFLALLRPLSIHKRWDMPGRFSSDWYGCLHNHLIHVVYYFEIIYKPRPKLFHICRGFQIRCNLGGGEGGGGSAETKVVENFTADPNPVKSPRGSMTPQTKSVGNLMKHKDLVIKLG